MAKFGVGQSVRRVEDQRFITGAGRYTDDINLPGQAYGYALRSPEAHARIVGIDIAEARLAPGVLAVITGAEIAANGTNALPCLVPIVNRDGSDGINPLRPVLCTDRVRHVGDHVAFVVAETASQAKDAAEMIAVEYESLPTVVDTETAADAGRPLVHDDVPANLAFDWQHGDPGAVEAALAGAAHVTKVRITNNRLVANPIEPRAAIGEYDAATGQVTLHACTQGGWLFTGPLAEVLKVEPAKVRVLTPDVGGGFGMKAFFYPEYALAVWAARQLGRPVKWTAERSSDGFLSDVMGRDHVTEAELGFDAEPQDRRHAGPDHGQHGRVLQPVRAVHPDRRRAQGPARRLRHQAAGLPGQGRADQHHAGRCLSRRRPAGIDLPDGAADRCRRARARRASERAAAQELRDVGRHAVQDHRRRDL